MTLFSVALGPTSSGKEDTDEDVLQSLPHLMVPVDLCIGSGDKKYYPYLALVSSGATYNFISQAVADRLGLEVAKAGKRKKKKKMLSPITLDNDEPQRATAVVHQMVHMRDTAGAKRSYEINFVVTNIAHYDLILGIAWLQKQNPDIQWDTGAWHGRTLTEAKNGLIRLASAGALIATMYAERMHDYKLHLEKLGLNPDHNLAGDVFPATGPEPTVSELYRAYAQVFLEADSESMSIVGLRDLAMKFVDSKQLPWGPIFNLSKKELDTLCSYLEV